MGVCDNYASVLLWLSRQCVSVTGSAQADSIYAMAYSSDVVIPDAELSSLQSNYTFHHHHHANSKDNINPTTNMSIHNNSAFNNGSYGNYTFMDHGMTLEHLYYYYLWTYVAPALLGSITVIGTLGNSMVIYVILSGKVMCSVTNILLLNLAITDIAVLLVCVPFKAHKYAASDWSFGDAMCKFVQYLAYVTTYVTIWSLVAVSAFRLLTVVYSKRTVKIRTKKNIIILVLLIWFVSMIVNIPSLLAYVTKTYGSYSYCGMHASATEGVFLSFFIMAYALPLLLISVMYILIILHLHRARNSITSSQIRTQNRTAKACKVIITVVLVFSLSWLPFHVNILVGLYGRLPPGAYYEAFRVLWDCMAYGNSCINPIIYNYVSSDFRKAFKDVVYCIKFRKRVSSAVTSTTQDRPSELTQMLETAL